MSQLRPILSFQHISLGHVLTSHSGLGKTEGGGKNTLSGMTDVVAQSGSTLPQVSSGGSLSGTMHIVTTDGAGPYTAIVDPTGTGAFSSGTEADVTTQVPGVFGEISPSGQVPGALRRALVKMGLMKRAQNVNKDYVCTHVLIITYNLLTLIFSLSLLPSQPVPPALEPLEE